MIFSGGLKSVTFLNSNTWLSVTHAQSLRIPAITNLPGGSLALWQTGSMVVTSPTSFNYLFSPVLYASFIVTFSICKLFSPILSSKFLKFYSTLSDGEKDFWNTLPSSTIHALFVTLAGLIVVMFEQDGSIEDYLHLNSRLGFFIMQISNGYFIADAVVILMSTHLRKDRFMLLHHLSGLVSDSLCLVYQGRWMILILLRSISEISTPFVNVRWILSKTNTPKSSLLFIFNGLAMTLSFLVSRIVMIPFFWYCLLRNLHAEMDPNISVVTPLYIKIWVVIAYVLLDLLNIFWASKMIKGFFKVIKGFQRRD